MSRRSRAREVVLQLLYQDDLNPSDDGALVDSFLKRRLGGSEEAYPLGAQDKRYLPAMELIRFAQSLYWGVKRNRGELDSLLRRRAVNWSLERMAAIDRNIMRLGAYEILYTETPPRVAINEALELAKRYGARQSFQFVNGILDRVLQERLGGGGETPAG